MIEIAITGAGGRMGRRLAAIAIESEKFDIVSAVEAPGHEAVGRDVGELAGAGTFGVEVTAELGETQPKVLIDFSMPESTLNWLEACRQRSVAMVIGTTGFTVSQEAAIADAAGAIPIVKAGNFSTGINLLCKLVALSARTLGAEYDIEITETHHRFKKDAPSGTAIMLARSICKALGKDYGDAVIFGRGGRQPRKPGEIGIHAIRVGDTVGEHAVHFGNLGETVTLAHSAHTRDTFARGALRAAEWVLAKPAGLYSMMDVLELK
ncbi:MAG: 4-hydroxy-tetrahydrodipicolinate reductase [Planctomycetota bacterium]